MKSSLVSMKVATAFLMVLWLIVATAGSAYAFSEVDLEAVSFQTSDYEDTLRLNISGYRIPHVYRHGMVNRIVVEFEDTLANPNLKNLVEGKRGCCVERFEVQQFRKTAGINDTGGVLHKLQNMNTLLIAYVEAGVDLKVNVTGRMITLTFYRIDIVSPQSRPAPVNEIENVFFRKDDDRAEFLLIQTTESMHPDVYEANDPKRLIITYPASYTNPRVENQVFRYMETAALFEVEMFGLGSVPLPYLNLDQSGGYHFVGIPTPLATTSYEERVKGLQSNDVVLTIYPKKDVEYRVLRRTGEYFELVFVKRLKMQEKACGLYEAQEDESLAPYAIQDEYERSIDFEEK